MLKKLFGKLSNSSSVAPADETTTAAAQKLATPKASKAKNVQTAHTFIEIGTELLSRPQALYAYLVGNNLPLTLVCCNAPSDCDFVDVMLRNKGIACKKLVGNIPEEKVVTTLAEIATGAVSVIVATDPAINKLTEHTFVRVVHYNATSDSVAYETRCGGAEPRIIESVTFVGPLDITNFHQLKKSVTFNIDLITLPSEEAVKNGTAVIISSQAKRLSEELFAKYGSLAEELLKDKKGAAKTVAYLLSAVLEKVKPEKQPESFNRDQPRDRFNNDDRNPRDRNPRERGRDGNRDDVQYGAPRERNIDDNRDSRPERRRHDQSLNSNNSDFQNDSRVNDRAAPQRVVREEPIDKKEVRFYFSKGKEIGASIELINQSIKEIAGEDLTPVRTSIRNDYSFFDMDESSAEKLSKLLSGTTGIVVRVGPVFSPDRPERSKSRRPEKYNRDENIGNSAKNSNGQDSSEQNSSGQDEDQSSSEVQA